MDKLKILLITSEFSDKSCGGAGVYAFELARALSKDDIKVHVITPNKETKKEILNNNLIVHWQKTIFKPFLRMPSFFNAIGKNYKKVIEKEKIDIIHSNECAGFLALGELPTLTIIHHPAFCEFSNFGLIQSIVNLVDVYMERKVLKKSDRIIAVSHLTKNLLISKNPNLEDKVDVVGAGVDLERFRKISNPTVRDKYGIREDEILLFFPGGARGRRKGSEILFEALSKLREEYNFKCIITGESREIGWAKKFYKNIKSLALEKDLILTGEIDYDELPKYYSASDIVVFPSLFEGFGIPVLEAMACGKPVITTRTGEIPYIITDFKNGLLINVNDSESLYEKIKFLIKNENVRMRLGKNGRKLVVEKYNWKMVAKGVKKIYQELIK